MSAYYDLFLKGVFDLASTMVVKSADSASSLNVKMKQLGYSVDDFDPTTWKYYMNLAGQYHASDEMMTITSMDTLETIDLTVDNLRIHRATRREYVYGSRYFNDVAGRYPDQEQLILGILNPIDINKAIEAKDHTILYYDDALIEDGEANLIEGIQTFTDTFFDRWDNPAYGYSDELYRAAVHGIYFAFLPKVIVNLRLANCKTDFAHSFHIRQYLASNGKLDGFYDFLTHDQRLWLYRNIRYINRNAGKTDTFEWLTENILTARQFPLSEYNLIHDYEALPGSLKPSAQLKRRELNDIRSALGHDVRSVPTMLELEQDLAVGNIDEIPDAKVYVPKQMENSLGSSLKTKILESNVLDTSDSEFYSLGDILLNEWLYLSTVGRYGTVISVDNPGTGDSIRLTAKEAFVVFLYTYNAARGFKLETIPPMQAMRVVRTPAPTEAELRELFIAEYMDGDIVHEAFDVAFAPGSYISVEDFREACVSIRNAMSQHRMISARQQDWRARVQAKQTIDRFYHDIEVDLFQGESFDDWFRDRGIAVDNLTDLEYDTLASQIMVQITGADLKATRSFREVHEAMLRLMTQLSSYSVQYIQQINQGVIRNLERHQVRFGEFNQWAEHLQKIRLIWNQILDHDLKGSHEHKVDITGRDFREFDVHTTGEIKIDATVVVEVDRQSFDIQDIRLGTIIELIDPPLEPLEDSDGTVINGYLQFETGSINELFQTTNSDAYQPITNAQRDSLFSGLGVMVI